MTRLHKRASIDFVPAKHTAAPDYLRPGPSRLIAGEKAQLTVSFKSGDIRCFVDGAGDLFSDFLIPPFASPPAAFWAPLVSLSFQPVEIRWRSRPAWPCRCLIRDVRRTI